MDSFQKRRLQNEKKFENWVPLSNEGRRYWYEVYGKANWKARYVKEVDKFEMTVCFYQEIYNSNGELVELHQKYPEDLGHQKIGEGEVEVNDHQR